MAVILVIEDDKDTCDMLARFLGRAGHSTVCASNGREAINKLTEHNPSVLLLDLTMPEMDGLSFLEVMRSYIRWSTLPVFLMTGVGDDAILEKAAALGVKKVFRKAEFKLDELLGAINDIATSSAQR
jgi:two-component system response regulator AtoC